MVSASPPFGKTKRGRSSDFEPPQARTVRTNPNKPGKPAVHPVIPPSTPLPHAANSRRPVRRTDERADIAHRPRQEPQVRPPPADAATKCRRGPPHPITPPKKRHPRLQKTSGAASGESGIRTHGDISTTLDFESSALDQLSHLSLCVRSNAAVLCTQRSALSSTFLVKHATSAACPRISAASTPPDRAEKNRGPAHSPSRNGSPRNGSRSQRLERRAGRGAPMLPSPGHARGSLRNRREHGPPFEHTHPSELRVLRHPPHPFPHPPSSPRGSPAEPRRRETPAHFSRFSPFFHFF